MSWETRRESLREKINCVVMVIFHFWKFSNSFAITKISSFLISFMYN